MPGLGDVIPGSRYRVGSNGEISIGEPREFWPVPGFTDHCA
jgi:hypothetical protein